jgi:hypothetical protein
MNIVMTNQGEIMDMETVAQYGRHVGQVDKETMQMVEGVAFDGLQDTMNEVFKHRGMAGLAPFLDRFLHELETFACQCCGRGWDEYLQRAKVSSHLAIEYLPNTRAALDAYRDSNGDFQRRMVTWERMLRTVPAQDRALVESIKATDMRNRSTNKGNR